MLITIVHFFERNNRLWWLPSSGTRAQAKTKSNVPIESKRPLPPNPTCPPVRLRHVTATALSPPAAPFPESSPTLFGPVVDPAPPTQSPIISLLAQFSCGLPSPPPPPRNRKCADTISETSPLIRTQFRSVLVLHISTALALE